MVNTLARVDIAGLVATPEPRLERTLSRVAGPSRVDSWRTAPHPHDDESAFVWSGIELPMNHALRDEHEITGVSFYRFFSFYPELDPKPSRLDIDDRVVLTVVMPT